MTALLPRVYVRAGVPAYPGRARLLTFPAREPQRMGDHAAAAVFWLVCGGLLGHGLTYEGTVEARADLAEALVVSERLSAALDWQACQYVYAAARVRRLPDWRGFVARADQMGEALAPEVLARCKGAR